MGLIKKLLTNFEEPADDNEEAIGDPAESEILDDKVQPALTSKETDKQDNKNQQGTTVTKKKTPAAT